MNRSYKELIKIDSFDERYNYLKLDGVVSEMTFGHKRFINQGFYRSAEWLRFRRNIIIRDNGCDLAHKDHQLYSKILIHHLNPITIDDLIHGRSCVLDEDNVVCVSMKTHNAIHYGDASQIQDYIPRTKNDTIPWR